MKNIVYLLFAVSIFTFVSCEAPVKKGAVNESEVVEKCEADNCQKACCLGCKATEGDAKCIELEDGSMPCCIKADANCCCGDATCDGSCHGEEVHDHGEEVHDHGAEGHSH